MVTPIPAPAQAGMSPPVPAGGGSLSRKGALPIKVIASIQAIYAKEEQMQLQLAGVPAAPGLQPGWGGKGRV